MAGDGILMPSGSGGLMRYNDEYKSSLEISPNAIVVFTVLVIVGMFILKSFTP